MATACTRELAIHVAVATNFEPAFDDIGLDVDEIPLKARIIQKAANNLKIEPGLTVFTLIKSTSFEL